MSYTNNYGEKLHKVREMSTLKELVDSGARLYGNKTAFLNKKVKGGEYFEIDYNTFKKDVDAIGTRLIDLGLTGQPIAIIGENCYQWISTYFAVVNGAGTVVPLDKELSKDEIYNLIQTAECKAIFYTSTYDKYFEDYKIDHKFKLEVYFDRENKEPDKWTRLVAEGQKLIDEGSRKFIDAVIDPDEVKILLFTSGTTGSAKAVMLSHRNLVADVRSTCQIVKLQEDERALSILPIHHTFESTMGIMTPLFQGGCIAFFEGLKYVVKNLEEAKCSMLVGVPLIFESIYDKIWKQATKSGKDKALRMAIKANKVLKALGIDKTRQIFKSVYASFGGNLRFFVTGAAAIDPNVVRGFQDLGFEIVMGYGLTETAPLLTGTPDFGNRYKKAGSVGPVIPDGELDIVDKNDEGIGEIIYRGPNVMHGYYNMQEKTDEVIIDGWFHTGDLGFVDKEGWLYITGRKKNIIVTKTGKNIYPEEIEKHLMKIKYIEECMVYGIDGDGNDDTVVSVQVRPDYEKIYADHGQDFDDDQVYYLIKKNVSEVNQEMPNYKRV
ncbi:MAG: AMP-binding protein, partial [Peptostreptococcaceae bacterium]|nr:AMP-binding protein [Peptostreptococcaceae bacterium]